MDVTILKANRVAKKALDLFESAVKGLEEANLILTKGIESNRTEVVRTHQEILNLESKIEFAKNSIAQQEDGITTNLKKIEKIKEIIGE